MPHLRVLNATFTGAKCRIYGCQTHLVCFTCKHFVRFSSVCSGKCNFFAGGQVGGLCRKRMMPMRPCLSPRRAFLPVFKPAIKEDGWQKTFRLWNINRHLITKTSKALSETSLRLLVENKRQLGVSPVHRSSSSLCCAAWWSRRSRWK